MTTEERAEVLVTARLLRAAADLQWLAMALTILSVARMDIAGIVLGLIAVFYGFRVSFDAKLFQDIATEKLTTAELDAALGALRKGKEGRAWTDRCRGARRLVMLLVVAMHAQILAIVVVRWSMG